MQEKTPNLTKRKKKHLTMKRLKGFFAKAFETNIHTLTYYPKNTAPPAAERSCDQTGIA